MKQLFEIISQQTPIMAYCIIFSVLVACGLGFPLPEDIPLIITGYLIWTQSFDIVTAFVVVLLGIIIGDSLTFFMGRTLGKKILENPNVQILFKPSRLRRAQAYFRKYGDKLIFFARFIAGLRALVFFSAGSMKIRYSRFLLLDTLAALLSVPIWLYLGYFIGTHFGKEITQGLQKVEHYKWYIQLIIFGIIFFIIAKTYLKYRRSKQIS